MTARLDYKWNLREVMATRGMFNTTDIRPLLAERDITLSPTQIWRLVTEKPERLNLKVLVALMDILDCRMDDLIEPVTITVKRKQKAVGETSQPSSGTVSGVGDFRPRRARITDR
jgi:DNA-binding Xre family transcriptional regulator